jgi:hypothetical protein
MHTPTKVSVTPIHRKEGPGMSAPARTAFRPVPQRLPTFPVITRHDTEPRQRGQVQYLTWRLGMWLKDHGVPKAQRMQFHRSVKEYWGRTGDYHGTCTAIESIMNGILEAQLHQIQAIYNDREGIRAPGPSPVRGLSVSLGGNIERDRTAAQ